MRCTVRTRRELEQAVKAGIDHIVVDDHALAQRVMRLKRLAERLRSAKIPGLGISLMAILLLPVKGRLHSGTVLPNMFAIASSASTGNPVIRALLMVSVAAFATVGILVLMAIYRDYDVEMIGPLGSRKVLMTRKRVDPSKSNPDKEQEESHDDINE